MENIDGDNINWVEMKPEVGDASKSEGIKLYPSPIPGNYESLYAELIDKCAPSKYATSFNYNYEMLNVANELYAKIIEVGSLNHEELITLHEKAVKELKIKISTEDLYNTLLKKTEPQRFMEPYNKDMVKLANEYHHKVLLYADNIEELEKIQTEIDSNHNFDISSTSNDNNFGGCSEKDINVGIIIVILIFLLTIILLFTNPNVLGLI